MPTINPDLIPTVTAGTLFDRLTSDTTLNIRWLTPEDPVLFEAMNRPIADIAVRQLIVAKTVDQISLSLSYLSHYPFLIPARVHTSGSSGSEIYLPSSWIWDLHASVPKKWESLRLAKIKRMTGSNAGGTSGDDITGTLRLIFTGVEHGSTTEVSLFMADVDYTIESTLSYQRARLIAVTAAEESNAVDAGEAETITGFMIFRTLDPTIDEYRSFFLALAPSGGAAPAVYEIIDTPAGGSTAFDDIDYAPITHGTGILVASAWNAIPALDSDVNTWLGSFNFPYYADAPRISTGPIIVTIPSPLFKEFDLCVPAGDEPTGDTSGEYSPVWVSKVRRCDPAANQLQFFFATYNIKDHAASTSMVEFATLTLDRTMPPDQIVAIIPIDDLQLANVASTANFMQDFGKGHVVLSSLWGGSSADVGDFFDAFLPILDDPADVIFTKSSTRIGAPGALSRAPRQTPTQGQHEALAGSTGEGRRVTPVHPSDDNRYVTEADQGQGDEVDFRTVTGIADNVDIEPIAYKSSLAHALVYLVVDAAGTHHDYATDVLPRLRVLLGRDPEFGDEWFQGTRFLRFTGDSWCG